MARRPSQHVQAPGIPPGLAAYISPGLHEELSEFVARWRKRGIALDRVEIEVRHIAELEEVLRRRRPEWKAEALKLRKLRARLITALRQTLAVYDRDPERTRDLGLPIPDHARAILEHLDAFRRANRGEKRPDDPRIDRADPLGEPIPLPRGPAAAGFISHHRAELARLGLSRREISWLILRARLPIV